MLIEHLLLGDIMRLLWLRGIYRFEVLQPQVDDSGYDVVLEANGIVRHVQLKSSFHGARTGKTKASLSLLEKPSACVVWVRFDPDTMQLGPFLWFGGGPGKRIPDLQGFAVAKHTRANSKGIKQERPRQRMIPKSQFAELATIGSLVTRLFGKFKPNAHAV